MSDANEDRKPQDADKQTTHACPTPPVSRSTNCDKNSFLRGNALKKNLNPSLTSGSHVTTEPCDHHNILDHSLPHVTTEPCTHQSLLEISENPGNSEKYWIVSHVTTEPISLTAADAPEDNTGPNQTRETKTLRQQKTWSTHGSVTYHPEREPHRPKQTLQGRPLGNRDRVQ